MRKTSTMKLFIRFHYKEEKILHEVCVTREFLKEVILPGIPNSENKRSFHGHELDHLIARLGIYFIRVHGLEPIMATIS